jgi:hypothetical protein
MRVKAAIVRDSNEVVSEIGDVEKPGDLEDLVSRVFKTAREKQIDLWNFTLQVTKA